MKRSRINDIMAQADDMIRSHGFSLPPWAYWTPTDFKANTDRAANVISARCGWDITD
jgi:D-lyxose ketol-isomerase